MSWDEAMLWLMRVAGWGQVALIIGSLGIPRELRWREKLAPWEPLMRQMFWVYAAYIWGINLCFGLISALGAPWLLDGSPLAACVTAFIFVYWASRVVVQYGYFDLSGIPMAGWQKLAKVALELLFIALTFVYLAAFAHNLLEMPA